MALASEESLCLAVVVWVKMLLGGSASNVNKRSNQSRVELLTVYLFFLDLFRIVHSFQICNPALPSTANKKSVENSNPGNLSLNASTISET